MKTRKQKIEELSLLLSVTPGEIKSYLRNVQARFILNKPSFDVIIDTLLAGQYTTLPSYQNLADTIKKVWTNNPSLQSKFTNKPTSTPALLKQVKRDSYDLLLGTPNQNLETKQKDKDIPKVIRKTINDEKRVAPNRLPRCPHGVARGKICAICEPDKFREFTGEG